MGRPKRCAKRPKHYISYNPISTTTTSTTIEPIDLNSYIQIPVSGLDCPPATTSTTTSTTTEQVLSDGCDSYLINLNNFVVKYICCYDNVNGDGSPKYVYGFFQGSTRIASSGIEPEILAVFDN